MFDIPILQTERLRLRAPTMADWPSYERLMLSERAQYMGGPHTRESAWGLFCSDVAQWALIGYGALMIEDLLTQQCVGQVGLNHGPLFPETELGWFVYPDAEGKGYAFEAATVLKNWAFESKGFETMVSYIDPDNIRSCRLATKLGAVLDQEALRPALTDLVFRHPRNG